MSTQLNSNIKLVGSNPIINSKASETYVSVIFTYNSKTWKGYVPIEYRRTEVSIDFDEKDKLYQHLNQVYDDMNPSKFDAWKAEQELFWASKPNADTTKAFFDKLVEGGWKYGACEMPRNPNPQRRIQDLKEFGYTIATDLAHYCPNCNRNTSQRILLPIPRGGNTGNGYETWSPALRKRIISILDNFDVYECVTTPHCLPDHKFSEIRWASSGFISGPTRNVAWRVLDAKFFGLPQQRKRLYVLAGDKDFHPEDVLFEKNTKKLQDFPECELTFEKEGHRFEVFRGYTDCLYAAYGTKWNGNAAALNGSLFVVQDDRIRRLSPLETERLMGFPDNYTDLPKARKTNRYQATGNSWAVPVVKWLGKRIMDSKLPTLNLDPVELHKQGLAEKINDSTYLMLFGKDIVTINSDLKINGTSTPEKCTFGSMKDIVSPEAPEDIYISPVGCFGIVRRKRERNLKINSRLEEVLLSISSNMSPEEIEKRSRVQKRGKFSDVSNSEDSSNDDSSDNEDASNNNVQVSIFDLATNE